MAFVARGMAVQVHRHHCLQLLIALRGAFASTVDGVSYIGQTHRLFARDVGHACSALDCEALVVFVEPATPLGRWMQAHLAEQRTCGLPADAQAAIAPVLARLTSAPAELESQRLSPADLQALLSRLIDASPASTPIDPRLMALMHWIDGHLDQALEAESLAVVASLSPDRMRHLFAAQVGMPLRQWIVWRRLRAVVAQVLAGRGSLTQAAMQAGFADQAHFCRLFARRFGVPATALLHNSRNVQFIVPTAQ